MLIGWLIGIAVVTPQTAGLYGVSVVYLIQISDYLQWFLRQIINMESMIVSVERAMVITNLPSEKDLRTPYDEQHKIEYEKFDEDEVDTKNKVTNNI